MKTLFIFLFAFPLLAAEPVHVPVKGMVCAFCARGLGEVLRKERKVERYAIDLEKGELTIWGKQALAPDEIRDWVRQAGLEAGTLK